MSGNGDGKDRKRKRGSGSSRQPPPALRQSRRWRESNHMTSSADFANQRRFLNSGLRDDPNYDYLMATGFLDKKVMWAARVEHTNSQQFRVMVSVLKCEYFKVDHGDRNCLKVGGVVFPLLQPESSNERVYEEIVAAGIPGSYLYWKVFTTNFVAQTLPQSTTGPLYSVRIMRSADRDDPRIAFGRIAGIYPYYRDWRHLPYLQFNSSDNGYHNYQHRFTVNEREPGILEATRRDALQHLNDNVRALAGMQASQFPVTRMWAIYVPNYVTLTVCVTNTKVNTAIQRPEEGAQLREIFVIQAGGLVVLLNYGVYYQFMNEVNGTEFKFQDRNTYDNKQAVRDQHNFREMRHLLNDVKYPLIELESPNEGNTDGRSYAGYNLEITNRGLNKRAVLQIPYGGTFRDAHELNIQPNVANPNNPTVEAINFIENQWAVPNEPYRSFAGPFDQMVDIDYSGRLVYPDYEEH